MKHEDYKDHVFAFTNEMNKVTEAKNHDYSVYDNDAMSNFKAIGTILGVSPTVVWSVLWMKHVTAVINHMAQGKTLRDETIHGRFIDLANYAMLGDALIKDLASSPENTTTSLRDLIEQSIDQATKLKSMFTGGDRNSATQRHRIDQHVLTHLRSMAKTYDQHGSAQSVGSVSGDPEVVRDASTESGPNGEPSDRPHERTLPPHITPYARNH